MPEAEWLLKNRSVHMCLTLLQGVILGRGHQTWCLMRACFLVHLITMSWHWWEGVGQLSQADQDLLTSSILTSGCDLGEDRGSPQQGSSGFVDFLCWCHFLLPWLPYWLSLSQSLALFWAAFLLFIPTRDLTTSFFPDRCFIPEASHTYRILHSPQILMSCIFLFI